METNDKVETSNEQTKKDFRFDDFQVDNSNEPDLKTESKVVEEIGAGLDQEKNEVSNCIKTLEQFPDEAVPELICLVHANTNHKNFLSKEFSEFWLKKQKIVKISIKSITVKIQEIAEHRNSEALSRKAWMVKDQFLKQYGILEPEIPNKWNYILEPEKVDFPDEAFPDLVCLVHANTNYKNFLANEFYEFWHKKQKLVKISIKRITSKIQEIANYQNFEVLSRNAWMVKDQFLKQYGILEPDIPNKWNYVLEQLGNQEDPNFIKPLEQFPDEAVPELICLVHANTKNKNFLAREFSEFWHKKHEIDKIPIKSITVKIQEIAELQNSQALSCKVWMVKDQFLKQYGILEPDIPNKWNYILEQEKGFFPDEAIPELISLVHANTNNKDFLAKEFSKFWHKKHEIVKIPIKRIIVKIKEIAEYQIFEALSRKAWMVKDQFLKQYGILEPDIPNKWSYILEQPGKKNSAAIEECEKDLNQVKHKAPIYNSSAYFYLSGSGGQKGPYPGIPNTKGLSEDESRGKIIEHFNKAQPTFISPEDFFCDKTELSAGKKSKKTQKVELKALAEEANEADIEMKLEPNSEEKTSETFAQYNEKRTVFPQGFWTEPTAVMPKDKTQYPDFPNIEGLSKEEADCAIIEFWKKIKEKREQGKQNAQERKRLIKSYEPKKNSKIRIPKDKSEFDEISKVLIGFPSTEGLSEEVARSVIMEYWMNQGLTRHGINYSIIPNDLGRYPGFPKTEGLPQEEVDEVVKKFWMEWQKNKTVFPKAFWEEPTALVPKDLRHHPGFPNTEGLSKEEADRAIIEYWKKEKLNKEQRKRDKKKMKNNRQREFEEKFKK